MSAPVSKPTTYDVNRVQQIVAYAETASTPKAQSTYDAHREHLVVEYKKPEPSTILTTFDLINMRVTDNAPRNRPGDRQVHLGKVWVWTGEEWLMCDEEDLSAVRD